MFSAIPCGPAGAAGAGSCANATEELRQRAARGKKNFNDVRICSFSKNKERFLPGFFDSRFTEWVHAAWGPSFINSARTPERFPENLALLAQGKNISLQTSSFVPDFQVKCCRDDERLKPVAAVGDPPAESQHRNRGAHCPPKWQQEVRHQAQSAESHPEDFALHGILNKILRPHAFSRKG
jgi:hypothetical protein